MHANAFGFESFRGAIPISVRTGAPSDSVKVFIKVINGSLRIHFRSPQVQ